MDLFKEISGLMKDSSTEVKLKQVEGEIVGIEVGDKIVDLSEMRSPPLAERVERLVERARKFEKVKNVSGHNRIIKDPLIRELFEGDTPFTLVGGAVIDITEGRKPKDYDFTSIYSSFIEKCQFVDTSDVADTYRYKPKGSKSPVTIQVLKTKTEDFDFTISACCIEREEFSYDDIYYLRTNLLEDRTYKTKILTPCSYEPKNALNSLLRIPHWRKKGYTITDNTYRSLLFAATKVSKERSGEFKKVSQ